MSDEAALRLIGRLAVRIAHWTTGEPQALAVEITAAVEGLLMRMEQRRTPRLPEPAGTLEAIFVPATPPEGDGP